MDRITESLKNEFAKEHGLTLPDDTLFEHFTGHLITSSHFSESFPSDDIAVGGGADYGVDCISIIVNGNLVTEPEEIEDLATVNGYLDVLFIFVQAERSSSFESAKIGQIGFGVTKFFSKDSAMPQNDAVAGMARIMDAIYARSNKFSKGNPQCLLYYATTGKWTGDQQLVTRRDSVIEDLRNLTLFRSVDFQCLGAEEIQKLYRDSKNAVSTEVTFLQRTVFPDIAGVDQAYMGLLPAKEFLKLIQNSNEEMLTALFFDNVRDWQEWNPVNSEIKKTLISPETRVHFPLLNNGVTIVAKRISLTGNKFLIEDYQIVNGCQSSYVLHETRQMLTEDVMVPIRLIGTTNEEVKNSIIKATNRQTLVNDEQLFALADFPKKLEAYFPTFDGRKKLYYERRSRQYNSIPNIEKVRVINMTSLVRAFASFFLSLPHRTTRNYKALLRSIGTEIFNKEHRLEPYYVAGYAHYKLEYLFRNQTLSSELKPARYHLLLGFRLLAAGSAIPRLNSHEMQRYCETLMEALWNDDVCSGNFQKAADNVRNVAAGNMHRDNIRTEHFTENFVRCFASAR